MEISLSCLSAQKSVLKIPERKWKPFPVLLWLASSKSSIKPSGPRHNMYEKKNTMLITGWIWVFVVYRPKFGQRERERCTIVGNDLWEVKNNTVWSLPRDGLTCSFYFISKMLPSHDINPLLTLPNAFSDQGTPSEDKKLFFKDHIFKINLSAVISFRSATTESLNVEIWLEPLILYHDLRDNLLETFLISVLTVLVHPWTYFLWWQLFYQSWYKKICNGGNTSSIVNALVKCK